MPDPYLAATGHHPAQAHYVCLQKKRNAWRHNPFPQRAYSLRMAAKKISNIRMKPETLKEPNQRSHHFWLWGYRKSRNKQTKPIGKDAKYDINFTPSSIKTFYLLGSFTTSCPLHMGSFHRNKCLLDSYCAGGARNAKRIRQGLFIKSSEEDINNLNSMWLENKMLGEQRRKLGLTWGNERRGLEMLWSLKLLGKWRNIPGRQDSRS